MPLNLSSFDEKVKLFQAGVLEVEEISHYNKKEIQTTTKEGEKSKSSTSNKKERSPLLSINVSSSHTNIYSTKGYSIFLSPFLSL